MPRVLGIDTSLTGTGLVRVDMLPWPPNRPFRREGEPVQWTAHCKLIKSKSIDGGFRELSLRTTAIVNEIKAELVQLPTLVSMEAPAFAMRASSHQHSTAWLWGKVYDACVEYGIPVVTPTSNQRMQYATGKGNADKDMVLAAAIKRWPQLDITNNNVADAVVLAAIGCRVLKCPIDAVPNTHFISKSGKTKGNWIERMAA